MKRLTLLLSLLATTAAAQHPFADVTLCQPMLKNSSAGPAGLLSVTNWAVSGVTDHDISFTVAGNNTYMLFSAANESGSGGLVNAVTYNGVSVPVITNAVNSFNTALTLQMRGLVAPAAGTHTLHVDLSGSSGDFTFSLSLWTNINQSTPYTGLTVNQSDIAPSPTALTVPTTSGERVYTAVALYIANPPSVTPPMTLIASTNGPQATLGAAYTNSTVSSVSVPFTFIDASCWWIQGGISLKSQ